MTRPLRIDVVGSWYHVTARGIERRSVFRNDRDNAHFLELLEEMRERYAVTVHTYVLMGNHYHLLIQTPEVNASQAMQWLKVSYSAWFNRRYGRCGPCSACGNPGVHDAQIALEKVVEVRVRQCVASAGSQPRALRSHRSPPRS